MRILKIEINNFGKLNNFVLEPGSGLNLIYGRNEDGKSTIMAFIRMMFYGNVGSAKELGANARKKYRPWNGSSMGGAIEFLHGGKRYRLQKRFGQTAGRDEVHLFNMDTGEPVALRSDEEAGMHFFGMTLDGFERSMFIGRSGGFESRDGKADGITERLVNLTTSNDENVSMKQTLEDLNKALEQLVSKRGNAGLLVETRERATELDRELREAKAEESAKRATRDELETLLTLQATEKERLEKVRERRKEADRLAKETEEKREKLNLAERRNALFEAEKQKREEVSAVKIQQTEEKMNQAREASESGKELNLIPVFAGFCVLTACAAIALAVVFKPVFLLLLLAIPVFLLGEMSAVSRRRRMRIYREAALARAGKLEEELEDLLEAVGRQGEEDEKNKKRLEAEEKDAADQLKRTETRRSELIKQLSSDDGLEDSIIEREQKISEIRAFLRPEGRALSEIIDERSEVLEQLAGYEERYEALKLAIEVMEEAGEELRKNFGPRLNTRTAEIFSGLTGGKYSNVNVSKNFGVRVLEEGDSFYHEGGYLSNGTNDQVYFALRLAIAEILTEAEKEMLPLLLDDIFEQYDDERTAKGLRFLDAYSSERGGQVILFTCHRHVLEMAEKVTEHSGFFDLSSSGT
jgi:uncharacterized protein YhaN